MSAGQRRRPGCCDSFDQIQLHPVEADELLDPRVHAKAGELTLKIEPTTFHLGEHLAFLDREAESIEAFRVDQRAAFAAERERWKASGEL